MKVLKYQCFITTKQSKTGMTKQNCKQSFQKEPKVLPLEATHRQRNSFTLLYISLEKSDTL